MIFGFFEALAAVYGGCIAMFSTWMLMKRVRLATEVAKDISGREVGILYVGAIQRFVLVLLLFIVGMAVLKLAPVPLLVGFVVSQGVFFLGAYLHGLHSSNR